MAGMLIPLSNYLDFILWAKVTRFCYIKIASRLSKKQVIDADLQSIRIGIKLSCVIMSRNIKNLVMSGFSILYMIDYGES